MDKLLQIKIFVSIADKASFSAVAREFKVTQSAISKAITALEKSLAVRLVSRSTRSVALTEADAATLEQSFRSAQQLRSGWPTPQ